MIEKIFTLLELNGAASDAARRPPCRTDIWIGEKSCLGLGHGTRMMRFAIERCVAEPEVRAILTDPLSNNVRAHRFYRRLGFEFVERRWFDDSGGCHVFKLERARWEALG